MSQQNTSPSRDPRRAIMDMLKRRGPLPASVLAQHFGVTAMAIRQHLYALQQDGLVSASAPPSGRGRPTKLWRLSAQAQKHFPDAHQELAVDILEHMRAQFGEDGLISIIDRHSAAQKETYGAALAGIESLEARVRALALQRTHEGYMAEVEPLEGMPGWLLIENHCPICAAARTCTRLCANELAVFVDVLGDDVKISRTEHILAKARRCAYRIEPVTD